MIVEHIMNVNMNLWRSIECTDFITVTVNCLGMQF